MARRPTRDEAKAKKKAMLGLIHMGFSAQQIARRLGISPQAVHKYLRRHQLKASRTGNHDLLDTIKVDNLITLYDGVQAPRSVRG
jgi:predicted transcriptional regulator